MAESKYVFDDVVTERELRRLRALEAVFDAGTQRQLLATGDWQGRHCLEVGGGAGSIAAWMQQQVGLAGRVVAADMSLRFLGWLPSSIEQVEGDIRQLAWAPETFDVIHVRYVLVHNPEPQGVLRRLAGLLKPGGWLLVEEPDFTAAHSFAGPAPLRESFALRITALEADESVERGGSPLAAMMSLSAEQLADKYVATGHATHDDVSRYREFAADPRCWAVYYSTVRVLARKAAQETPKS